LIASRDYCINRFPGVQAFRCRTLQECECEFFVARRSQALADPALTSLVQVPHVYVLGWVVMEGLAGSIVQSSLPCHHRTCRSQTIGRTQQLVQTPKLRLDRQFSRDCKPFSSVTPQRGASYLVRSWMLDQSSFALWK